MNCVDAGNVFVHLFLQTKVLHTLTNQKLQYLLIIAQMARLSRGRTLFEDDIKNFKQSFAIDAVGNNFMSYAELVSGKDFDVPIRYNVSYFVLPFSKKTIYEIGELPSDEDRELLVRVFLAFGAYHEKLLCRLLGEFKVFRSVPTFSIVPKENIRKYLKAVLAKDVLAGNAIFEFLKDYYLEFEKPAPAVAKKPVQKKPVPKPVVETPKMAPAPAVLKGLSSLQYIMPGKQYSIYVELASPDLDFEISLMAIDLQEVVPVQREQLSDTLYRLTFVGVASRIQVSTQVVNKRQASPVRAGAAAR